MYVVYMTIDTCVLSRETTRLANNKYMCVTKCTLSDY